MGKKKMILLMCMVTMGIFALSACSGGEAEPDVPEQGQKKESSADLSQFADCDGDTWMESWNGKTASGLDFSARLNVYMSVPKLKRMSTVEVRKYVFNNEDKKKMMEGIFDKDIYYNDDNKLPKSVLKQYLSGAEGSVEYYEDQLQKMKDGNTESGSSQSEMEGLLKEQRENIKKYKKLIKKAPRDFQKVQDDDYEGNSFLGEREGIEYILRCDTDEGTGQGITIDMSPSNEDVVKPDRMKGKGGYCYSGETGKELENDCKMKKEDAEKLAGEFLQKAGFTDLVQEEESVLMWNVWNDPNAARGDPDESFADGWVFHYAPGVDGVSFPSFGIEADYQTEAGDVTYKGYPLNCRIQVSVTDKGVIHAIWFNPVEVLSVTPDVKLLPVDNIKNIIKEDIGVLVDYLSENGFFAGMNEPVINFNRMDLIYYRVSDPKDKERFTYVPAWKLRRNTNDRIPFSFVVNAMDGSVLEDWDSEWQIVS